MNNKQQAYFLNYFKTLLSKGVDEKEAKEIVRKMAEAQKSNFTPSDAKQKQKKETKPMEDEKDKTPSKPGKLKAAKAIEEKIVKIAKESEPRIETASEHIEARSLELKQAEILKGLDDTQLSLFDFAPWPDSQRAIPNDWARSALFTTRGRSAAREVCSRKPIFSISKDSVMTYTGIELRAEDDELVWVQVLEYAKKTPINSPVQFTFYQICKDLDWRAGGSTYKRIEDSLTRLQATAIQFTSKRVARLESLSMIERFSVVNRGHTRNAFCEIQIAKEMIILFGGSYYTTFVWDRYRKLSPTARRLYDYIGSHQTPYPIKIETFKSLCGSQTKELWKLRQQIRKACGELVSAEMVSKAWVEKDLIHCERKKPKNTD